MWEVQVVSRAEEVTDVMLAARDLKAKQMFPIKSAYDWTRGKGTILGGMHKIERTSFSPCW